MPHESGVLAEGRQPPITPATALQRLSRLLDGRVLGLDAIDQVADIIRQAGHQVRSPEQIKVTCPSCGRPDITVSYEAVVGIRITADNVRCITLFGFSNGQAVRVYCHDCDAEYDETDLCEAREREMVAELAGAAAHGTEAVEALRRAARAIVQTLDAAAELVPDRYQAETVLEGERS
jgi:hypothetical protein